MRLLGITAVAVAGLVVPASAVELTEDNWVEETAGKVVFIKFHASWCGHCRKIKPDWDKLMRNWNKGERFKTAMVGDVECTGAGKSICSERGINKYPKLLWGDADNLEPYAGDRDYESLKKFAFGNLKPSCSPSHQSLCSDKEKEALTAFMALPKSELAQQIQAKEEIITEAEEKHHGATNLLEVEYEKLQEAVREIQEKSEKLKDHLDADMDDEVSEKSEKEKMKEEYAKHVARAGEINKEMEQETETREATVASVKESGLRMMKAVRAHVAKSGKDEL